MLVVFYSNQFLKIFSDWCVRRGIDGCEYEYLKPELPAFRSQAANAQDQILMAGGNNTATARESWQIEGSMLWVD